jgi:hypothetical protein
MERNWDLEHGAAVEVVLATMRCCPTHSLKAQLSLSVAKTLSLRNS